MSFYRFLRKRAAFGGFALLGAITALADNPVTVVNVNANAISPLIYGTNWGDRATMDNLNLPVNRGGGNTGSTYNWQINATNRGGDWYYESLADAGTAPSASADAFITSTKAGGAQPMITIPMVDWVAKLGPNRERRAAYSVAKYSAQVATDPCGGRTPATANWPATAPG